VNPSEKDFRYCGDLLCAPGNQLAGRAGPKPVNVSALGTEFQRSGKSVTDVQRLPSLQLHWHVRENQRGSGYFYGLSR
jgi:hypothetical protein